MLFALTLIAAEPTDAKPASDPAPQVQAQVKKEKKPKEKKICRANVDTIASRMSRTLCLTESEWAKRDGGVSDGDLQTIGGR